MKRRKFKPLPEGQPLVSDKNKRAHFIVGVQAGKTILACRKDASSVNKVVRTRSETTCLACIFRMDNPK